MLKLFLTLFAGGVATSFAEHLFNYNLFSYVLEGFTKLKGLFAKAEAEVVVIENKFRKKKS